MDSLMFIIRRIEKKEIFDTDPVSKYKKRDFFMSSPEQAGKEYELLLIDSLTKIFGPENVSQNAAGSSLYPDVFFRDQFRTMVRVEAKTNIGADFGQKGITIDEDSGKWKPIEKKFATRANFTKRVDKLYSNIFDELNLHEKIVDAWNLPNKDNKGIDVKTILYLIETKQLNKVLNYERLLVRKEKKFDPYRETTLVRDVSESIVNYYNSLNTYYIQIKDRGFYYMGQDKNDLNKKFREKNLPFSIPRFSPSESKLNLRGKTSQTGQYFRPTLRFKISGLEKSSVSLEDTNFVQSLYLALWS